MRPADRDDANTRSSSTGKPRSASVERSTPPTSPVAPTMPTRMRLTIAVGSPGTDGFVASAGDGVELEGAVEGLHAALDVGGPYDAADADRGGRDHLDVHTLPRQHLEHRRRHPRMRLHPRAHEA